MRRIIAAVRRAGAATRAIATASANDIVGICGLAFVSYGVSLWSEPAGYVTGGASLVIIALVRGK